MSKLAASTREAAGSCSSSSILDIIPVPSAHEAIKTNEIKQAKPT
jgi:hypothetical protein